MGLCVNKPSLLIPYLGSRNHRVGSMRSSTTGLLVVAIIGYCVDEPLFYYALLLAFVHAMMILMPESAYNRHNRGEGRKGGGDNSDRLIFLLL